MNECTIKEKKWGCRYSLTSILRVALDTRGHVLPPCVCQTYQKYLEYTINSSVLTPDALLIRAPLHRNVDRRRDRRLCGFISADMSNQTITIYSNQESQARKGHVDRHIPIV